MLKEELENVLQHLNDTGIVRIMEGKKEWIKLTEMTEVNHNTNACRLVLNIVLTEDHANAASLFLYKDKFRMVRYWGINPEQNTCKDMKNTEIRTNIESEEEFFQESTVADLNELVYDEYQVIQEITSVMDKHLWSVI